MVGELGALADSEVFGATGISMGILRELAGVVGIGAVGKYSNGGCGL